MTQPKRRPRRAAERTTAVRVGPPPWPHDVTFGPAFFAEVLPAMVKACPCPDGHELTCRLFLGDGSILDVVQVLALTERFCLLAVVEGEGDDGVERTEDDVGLEAVPYDLIIRSSIRPVPRRPGFGFRMDAPPSSGAVGDALQVDAFAATRPKRAPRRKAKRRGR